MNKHSLALNKLGFAIQSVDAILKEVWLLNELDDMKATITGQLETAVCALRWIERHCEGVAVAHYKQTIGKEYNVVRKEDMLHFERKAEEDEFDRYDDVLISKPKGEKPPSLHEDDVPEGVKRMADEAKKISDRLKPQPHVKFPPDLKRRPIEEKVDEINRVLKKKRENT